MNRMLVRLSCVAIIVAWSSAGFAQRQTAVGPGVIPLNAAGVTNGVDLSSSGTTGTLNVGVIGGPEMDIFKLNNPPVAGFVAVSTGASSQGNIVFNSSSNVFGAIGVTQPGGPFLLNIAGGNTGTVVNFQGPVFATTMNVTGAGAMNFNSGSTNIVATNFAADGTINLAPNTTVIGALTTTAGAQTGTLGLGSASVLNGAVGGAIGLRAINVNGGSNTAGVTATITGATNAYTFNLGTNTLNVGGALTIANGTPSGVINTTLASPTVFGNIRPVGATNLGSTLHVDVTVPSTALIPVGTQFNIVQTQAGTLQSGTNGSVVIVVRDPNNPLYTFSAVPPAGTVAGLVAITTTGIPLTVIPNPILPPVVVVPLPPTVPIAAPLVPAIINIVSGGAPPPSDFVAVVTAINAFSDPAAVVNAVAQLAPSTPDLAAPLVTFQAVQQFQDLWLTHMDDSMCTQVNALNDDKDPTKCPANTQHGGAWLKSFGYFGAQGSQGAFQGYNSITIGLMMGYDAPIAPDVRVGLGVGYARSIINGSGFSANTDFNTYQASAYIAYEPGPWFVDGDVSFGWNNYTGTRNISFPGVNLSAQAAYNGQDYTAYAVTGYHFYTQGFTITPMASLQYTYMNLGSYTETGADSVNLNVNSQNYNFLQSRLGVKAAHPFATGSGTVVPELHANWLHALSNPAIANTATFSVPGSPAFTTPGLKDAADTLNGGLGLTFLSCACTALNWSLEAVYDFYWRPDNYTAQQGMIRFTARF